MRKYVKKIKHFIEYILFIVLTHLLRLFNIDNSAKICSRIARMIGRFLPVSKIAHNNLYAVFGENIDCKKTIDLIWDNFGRFIGEFPHMLTISDEEILRRVEIEGIEYVENFKKSSQPFLLFSGHFANWDFALKIINNFYDKFGIVYRKANNPYIDKIINKLRADDNLILIEKGPYGAKSLIKAIKSGYSIAMLVDQKMNDGIEVPFFGKPAMTAHAIAKFAIQFQYPIVPLQIIRTHGTNFKIIIHKPLEINPIGNMEIDCYNIMLNINQILEQWIRKYPEQWFWFHNRWKI